MSNFLKLNILLLFIIFCLPFNLNAKNLDCNTFKENLNLTQSPHNFVDEDGNYFLKAPYWFNIRKLKDINLKENFYTADFKFRVLYLEPRLEELAKNLNVQNGFFCPFNYEDIKDRYKSLEFYFTSIEDLNITNDTINFNYVDGDFFVVRLVEKTSVFSTTNILNFKKFPFDEQVLDFRIYLKDLFLNEDVSENKKETKINVELTTDSNSSMNPTSWLNAQIFGWNIKDYKIEFDKKQEVIISELLIKRDSFFYITKVIFPVLFIALISWSVFLMHPRNIEARTNVTIVCLLALIAYNFVIDKTLPKVSYLTIMDVVILSSYVFAGSATIYSIFSYRKYIQNEGDNIPITKIDNLYKNLSIIIFILVISSLTMIIYIN